MKYFISTRCLGALLIFPLTFAASALSAQDRVVTRLFPSVETLQVKPSAWNLAQGVVKNSTEVPEAAVTGESLTGSIEIDVDFNGKGFAHYTAETGAGTVPGPLKSIDLWAKSDGLSRGWNLSFKDADGKSEVDKKKLECSIKGSAGKWVHVQFPIPAGWKQPVSFSGIVTHNWGANDQVGRASLLIAGLKLETDVSAVSDPAKLLKITTVCPAQDNIFIEGETPRIEISAGSWLGKELSGELTWALTDNDGQTVQKGGGPVKFSDSWNGSAQFAPGKFGTYFYSLSLKLSEGAPIQKKGRIAYLPKPAALTAAEKQSSPYALNIHGGIEGVGYNAIARLGFTWIRDYAYTYNWVTRAKGSDSKYGGWPWYPQMDAKIKESGLMLLPCFMGSVRDSVKAGKTAMDKEMRREMMMFMAAFPQYTAWELDNEYDLHYGKDEVKNNWATYKSFHKTFGDTVNMMDDTYLSVEQGAAGVYPERTHDLVKSGAFDSIDVVNGHFYCGTQAPELNRSNYNTGGLKGLSRYYFDMLRDFVAAASCDGKKRQAWITEFGWDTLAGHIVSEKEQAAYLQRGYMLGLQAGLDKMFWYWNRDTKKKPTTFFDGCGILDPNDEPKPACAAISALTHFMALPKPVGTFVVGENGMGHVFKDGNKLVAAAFKIDVDGPAVAAEFKSGKLFDSYANPLAQAPKTLDILPTWVVGLSESDPFYIQTAYDLKSRYFQKCAAGDVSVIELRACNNRKSALSGTYSVKLPAGWSCDKPTGVMAAVPGETNVIQLTVNSSAADKGPFRKVIVLVKDGAVEKPLVIDFEITSPAAVMAEPLVGGPGKCKTKVTVSNVSLNPKSFTAKVTVPAVWKVTPASLEIQNLAPGESKEFELELEWGLGWKTDERAGVEVFAADGAKIAECGLVPDTIQVPVAGEVKLDGSFGTWPKDSLLPAWATAGAGQGVEAVFHLAVSPKGLLVGVEVVGSDAKVSDPSWFWTQDTLEVFVEPLADRTWRGNPKDMHQFWLCPLVGEQRAYLGRWKMKDEIPANLYDVKEGVQSFSAKTAKGYVMQALIPASQIEGWSTASGTRVGIDLVVSVNSVKGDEVEVCWPRGKDESIQYRPSNWGLFIVK